MKMKKILTMALAAVLLVAVSVGGTIAYLKAETPAITNVFTPSEIEVTLSEDVPVDQSAQIIPGVNIPKDPEVTADADVPYYVFVKITEKDWNSNLTWDVDRTKWSVHQEKDANGIMIIYKEMVNGGELAATTILANNEIVVSPDMLESQMPTAEPYPTLAFAAYAVQMQKNATENFTVAEAWAEASK